MQSYCVLVQSNQSTTIMISLWNMYVAETLPYIYSSMPSNEPTFEPIPTDCRKLDEMNFKNARTVICVAVIWTNIHCGISHTSRPSIKTMFICNLSQQLPATPTETQAVAMVDVRVTRDDDARECRWGVRALAPLRRPRHKCHAWGLRPWHITASDGFVDEQLQQQNWYRLCPVSFHSLCLSSQVVRSAHKVQSCVLFIRASIWCLYLIRV